MEEVGFGLSRMAWNGGSQFWPDWISLEWRKLVVGVDFGLTRLVSPSLTRSRSRRIRHDAFSKKARRKKEEEKIKICHKMVKKMFKKCKSFLYRNTFVVLLVRLVVLPRIPRPPRQRQPIGDWAAAD
jgi:hypothetical protein